MASNAYDKITAKANALLIAGDALAKEFLAESRALLRRCRKLRLKAREIKEGNDNG